MSHTVLIVDDSIPQHAVVRAHLESKTVKILSAYDGETALAMAASFQPSLILLDVNMPGLDGFQTCKALKANPITASIPVIFLTANSIVGNKVIGLDMGAVDYLTKPFKPEELQARVRLALRAKPESGSTNMTDARTGLWNRAYLTSHLPAQLSMAKRTGRPLACIVTDIDQLSSINARHGEGTGNDVLRAVGAILHGHCRAEDILCRMSDGKFVMLLSGTNSASAVHMADRLRADIERRMASCGGAQVNVTCSFGVADTLVAGEATLLERADAAAQRAKHLGRNCVSIARHAPEKHSVAA